MTCRACPSQPSHQERDARSALFLEVTLLVLFTLCHFMPHISSQNDDKVGKTGDYLDILETLTPTSIWILSFGKLRTTYLLTKTPVLL